MFAVLVLAFLFSVAVHLYVLAAKEYCRRRNNEE